MGAEIGNLDLELIKWLNMNKKKIVLKFDESGGEIYVDDKEK